MCLSNIRNQFTNDRKFISKHIEIDFANIIFVNMHQNLIHRASNFMKDDEKLVVDVYIFEHYLLLRRGITQIIN